jgi:hypothetical protein
LTNFTNALDRTFSFPVPSDLPECYLLVIIR